ncbi:transmembrane protein [Cavenderia fasciculata]|uniref:Transmembrane protein n=1 Tax=Cavenderia fasciculata TaxID=261658 RepID=F4Q353_CACFS|nr:uncharacterized protein DFA_07753 [Cavenderia fasciculata]EGG16775.1 transmembrane protein [Cavenderia fasciculata]|eukprot:XP_004355249.1 transmembrane protein [Cavenderia fasciculata]
MYSYFNNSSKGRDKIISNKVICVHYRERKREERETMDPSYKTYIGIDEEDLEEQLNNNQNTNQNNNNDTRTRRLGTIKGEYDSDEENEYLENERLQYEQSLLLKEVQLEEEKEKEQEEEIKLSNHKKNISRKGTSPSISNNSPIISPKLISTTSTSTTTTSTSTSSTSTTTNNNNNNYNFNNNNEDSSQQPENIAININDDDDGNNNNNPGDGDNEDELSNEIGLEAQNILFIQNELSRPLTFYSILKRLLFLCILYLFPVSLVLVIALAMDWKHGCDEPLHNWSIGQVVIQTGLVLNFLFLLLKLPTQDDNGQPSPEVARVQLIFRNLHNVLSCSWITWFIVGIVCTFKARAHDTCTSSAPYLFWVSYSVVIFQIVIASLAMLFCCCSCIFSLMRLGVHIEMVQAAGGGGAAGGMGDSRGATDTMLRKLSTKKFKTGVLPNDDCSCAICLTDYVDGEKIRILPCKHHYHLNCIDRWLIQNKSCPFCKRDIDTTPTPTTTPATSSNNNNNNPTSVDQQQQQQDGDGIEMTTLVQTYDSQMKGVTSRNKQTDPFKFILQQVARDKERKRQNRRREMDSNNKDVSSIPIIDLYHHLNKHRYLHSDCILSAIRGLRNGILTGVRIRIPYIFQAVIYAAIFRDPKLTSRVKFVIKQMFFHGRNLGLFVGIYKSICCIFRNIGIKGGIDSLVAGFIGGYVAFGDSKSTSGSVNNQIVLYLFARALIGIIQSGVKRNIIPQQLSTTTPQGFRIFAGVTLALILYLTEYEPDTLNSSFMGTMTYLYHKSDSGPMLPQEDRKFSPIILVILISIATSWKFPQLSLDNILAKLKL